MSTKIDNINAGRNLGDQISANLSEATLRQGEVEARSRFTALVSSRMADEGTRSSVMFDAAVQAAMVSFRTQFNDLPDIRAARLVESFNWNLTAMERNANETVAKFKKNLDENPCYAFEWSDAAMKAAAQLHICAKVRAQMAGGMDLDGVQKDLTEQVIRAAKYGSHSTSTSSNVMAEYKLAAMAELVRL